MGFIYFLIVLLVFLLVYTIISSLIDFSLYLTTRYKFENYRLFLPTIFTILFLAIAVFFSIYIFTHLLNTSILDLFIGIMINSNLDNNDITYVILTIIANFIAGIVFGSLSYYSININTKKIVSIIAYYIKTFFKSIINIFVKLINKIISGVIKIKSNKKDADIIDINEEKTSNTNDNNATDDNNNSTQEEVKIDDKNEMENINVSSEYEKKDIISEPTIKIELIENDNTDITNDSSNYKIMPEEKIEKLDYSSAFISSLFTNCLVLFFVCIFFLIGYALSGTIMSAI